jgi:hypothetical protein
MAITQGAAALSPTGGEALAADTEDALQERFLSNGWTDRLPVVIPTEDRVDTMLGGTRHAADEVIGARGFTVRDVAVNAVMAGARADYLPAILALAASGQTARDGDPSSAAAMVVVNGPVRLELEMNAGIGAMGPYNRANSTIGRAFGLLSQNLLGGSVPGVSYFGSQGNNYAFSNICFPENEERSPWAPFHVEHGFSPDTSTVSVFGSCRHNTFTLGLRETHWRTHVTNMLLGMDPTEHPLFALDPIAARQFIDRGGFDTKAKLADWVFEAAQLPARDYWGYRRVQQLLRPRAEAGEEPYASQLSVAPEATVHLFPRDSIETVIVGGETNGYWRMFGAAYLGTYSIDTWR